MLHYYGPKCQFMFFFGKCGLFCTIMQKIPLRFFPDDILAILYLLCISERILYLIDDITITIHVADTQL